MASKKPSVLKRERERARDERAARKRADRARRRPEEVAGPRIATRDELDGYGLERRSSGNPFDDASET